MQLFTMGGLKLEPSGFKRVKPLLLLAYLSIEGRKERRYVAELFWPEASHALSSLSVALSQLRKVSESLIEADDTYVATCVPSDAQLLLEHLDKSDFKNARILYQGQFLDGVNLGLGEELEEWFYQTREYFATRVQEAIVQLAEQAAHEPSEAKQLAEKAYSINHLNPDLFQRLYALFTKYSSPRAKELKKLADEFGVEIVSFEQRADERSVIQEHSLPALTTPLIGRDPELVDISQLIEQTDCRLLTILGAGGMGKTKLSLHVGHDSLIQSRFPDGIYFIALDVLSSFEFLSTAIGQALGLELSPKQDPKNILIDSLKGKNSLLILDNFEHLVEGAELLSQLLTTCPQLKLLVTSREKLNLQEEWVLPLEGLPYPTKKQEASENALYYDAVQLFIQRAKRTSLKFNVDANIADIFELCRLVEGSPLGLELAASWVASLPLNEIVKEIKHNYDFLETDVRNLPERHKSIRAAFEHSWRLLSKREQDALAKLAVFRGGFSRQAANVVVNSNLAMLAKLVNKSLLSVSEHGRYGRHALLYQYMQEKLEAHEDKIDILQSHSDYFLAWISEPQTDLLNYFDDELENIRVAWRHAEKTGAFERLGDLSWILAKQLDARAKQHEGKQFFANSLARLDQKATSKYRGRLYTSQAYLTMILGAYQEAETLLTKSLHFATLAKDDRGLFLTVHTAALIAKFTGDYQKARLSILELLKDESLSDRVRADLYGNLGIIEQDLNNHTSAKDYLLKALAISKQLGDHEAVVVKLLNLGTLELNTGRLKEAEIHYQDSLSLAKTIGRRNNIPVLSHNLAIIASKQEKHAQAKELACQALHMVQETGEKTKESGMFATLSWISLRAGNSEDAETYVKRSLEVAYGIQDEPSELTALLRYAELAVHQKNTRGAARLLQLIVNHKSALGWTKARAKELLELLKENNDIHASTSLPALNSLVPELLRA